MSFFAILFSFYSVGAILNKFDIFLRTILKSNYFKELLFKEENINL